MVFVLLEECNSRVPLFNSLKVIGLEVCVPNKEVTWTLLYLESVQLDLN